MSLIVNANTASTFEPVPAGTHLAICNMLVDLGTQYNEKFDKHAKKVFIGWEIPGETYTVNGEEKPHTIRQQYTASLNEKSSLRRDLAAWRGRDFTKAELDAFDLHNIVGKPCYINVIHYQDQKGNNKAGIKAIMALPKGTQAGELSAPPLVFDLDDATIDSVELLPAWIAAIVKESDEYKAMTIKPVELHALEDADGDLPF